MTTVMQAIMMTSNECSSLKSFHVNSSFDHGPTLCKTGYFCCQYLNGSSICEGEAIFDHVSELCRKKNATFVKPISQAVMQKVFDRANNAFVRFWTPIKRMTSTTIIDQGVITALNDSTPYFGLEIDLNDGDSYDARRWDNQQSSTAYKIQSNQSNNPLMPFVDYMFTNETRVLYSVKNALIKPFFENTKKLSSAFHGCLCTKSDIKMIHPGFFTLVPPIVVLISVLIIYIFSLLFGHLKPIVFPRNENLTVAS